MIPACLVNAILSQRHGDRGLAYLMLANGGYCLASDTHSILCSCSQPPPGPQSGRCCTLTTHSTANYLVYGDTSTTTHCYITNIMIFVLLTLRAGEY